MKTNSLIKIFIAVTILFSTISCTKDKYMGDPAEGVITISSITIKETPYHADPSTIYLLENQVLNLDANVQPEGVFDLSDMSWTSSNEDIVKVDDKGTITALKSGSSIVRVTPEIGFGPTDATPSLAVNVLGKYEYMTSVVITNIPELTDSLDVGASWTLDASYETESGNPATFERFKWESSDSNIAVVNSKGVVTGVSKGKAIITCTADDQNPNSRPSTSVTVNVKQVIPIETLVIDEDPELRKLGYGQKYKLKYTVTPEDATVSSIVWDSDNPEAIAITESGELIVNTLDAASATITATAGDIVKKVSVSVAQGRLCYSFADEFSPWHVTTNGASVHSSDGEKTIIEMTNQTNEGAKHRGDINLVTNGSGNLLTVNLSTYRYLAVKIRVPSVLIKGANSQGTIKLEMFDNPRTIGPVYRGTTPGSTNENNQFEILGAEENSIDEPNVLYFDMQGEYNVKPTTWDNPFNLTQFKFVIADYPAAVDWNYDIYWVRTFESMEEMIQFVNSEE